jgi:lysophospholipase L1-like esterase
MPPRKPTLVEGRRVAPAGHVLLTGLLFLGLGTFLNAASLLKTAERQPAGTVRTVAVGVMSPLAEMSDVLLIDRPRQLLDRALGRAPAAPEPDDTGVAAPPATILHPEGGGSTTTTGAPDTPTTTTPAADLREVTPADPLKLWIIGDSFVELFGPALQNDAADTGVVESEVDFRFVSGLTRPDYFDWPAHIAARLPEVQPDAVVVMFGGNDGQPMYLAGGTLETETPEWFEEYHARVGAAMDLLLTGAARVYWVGLPIMRDDQFTQRVIGFNEVYQEEAARRPGVVYLDTFPLFQDENGEYSTYLKNNSGDLLEMRTDDGAHFTWNGAYRLSWFVLNKIADEWGFADTLS